MALQRLGFVGFGCALQLKYINSHGENRANGGQVAKVDKLAAPNSNLSELLPACGFAAA